MYISGPGTSPLARKFRTRTVPPVGQAPRHKSEIYQDIADRHIGGERMDYAAPTQENLTNTGLYIAPFSTLGSADSWPLDKWEQLLALLPEQPELLALEADRTKAEEMAEKLGIAACLVQPEEVPRMLGAQCRLYAVDGLLPQLAALAGCPCHVLMASRLAAVYSPLGAGHHVVCNHTPCHPCYRNECDQAPPCTAGVTPQELLG
jgi:ADP-heptose:LPS heptosyltransferase